eukprot:NODE_86_length_22163_cov_0.379442.p9 type:complete len:312 gc:universal NODE_86_length_22163_cov_0.379442:12048-11113(-)
MNHLSVINCLFQFKSRDVSTLQRRKLMSQRDRNVTKFVLVHGKDNTQEWKAVHVADPEHLKLMNVGPTDIYDYDKHFKQIGKDSDAVFVPFNEPTDDFDESELDNPDIQELIEAMENEDFVVNEDGYLNEENLNDDGGFVEELIQVGRAERSIDRNFDAFMKEYEEEAEEEQLNELNLYAKAVKPREKYYKYEYNPEELKEKILGIVHIQNKVEHVGEDSSNSSSEDEELSWTYDMQQLSNANASVRPIVIELPKSDSKSSISIVKENNAEVIEICVPNRKKDETKEEKKLRKDKQKLANKLSRQRHRLNR